MISAPTAPAPASTTPRQRPRVWLALILLLVLIFVRDAVHFWGQAFSQKATQVESTQTETDYNDYVVFYAAGRLVLEGHGSQLYDVNAVAAEEQKALGRPLNTMVGDGILPFFNPPFLAAFLAPLTLLPLTAFAAVLFVIVGVSALAVGLALDRWLALDDWLHRLVFWSWYLSLSIVAYVALQSQVSMLVILAWLGFVALQIKGRELASGACLALVLVKPQIVLVMLGLLLWRRQWRTLAGFVAVAALFALLSILVAGPGVVVDYPRFLIESAGWQHEKGVVLANMYGWSGFYARLVGGGDLHTLLALLSGAATVAATVYVCRDGWQPASPRFPLQAGAVLAASMLISLHFYQQDLALQALLLAFGGAYWRQTRGGWGWWPGIAGIVWGVQAFQFQLLYVYGINIQTPTLLCVFGALVYCLVVRRQAAGEAEQTPLSPVEAAA